MAAGAWIFLFLSTTPIGAELPGFLRGMTVSCPRWGPIWGSPDMEESLGELAGLGVEWVAIHPYARIEKNGEIRHRPAAGLDFLEKAVGMSGDAGIEMFWKPHLSYWGNFEWRGDIEFGDDEAAWERFFRTYGEFIVDQARFAEEQGVKLFAVGTELEKTTHREREWRRIVAEIRRVYSGELTYAANWDRLENVSFWDALDLIGVQAYFPLADSAAPSRAELDRGWDRALAQLTELSKRHGGKRVLFTEIGYDEAAHAAREPWLSARRAKPGERAGGSELRRSLMDVALERLESEKLIAGLFWWKWIPGPEHRRDDFSMREAEVKRILHRHWADQHRPFAAR